MKRILFAIWLLLACTLVASADFRIWPILQFTNAPAQSNTLTIGTNVLTWRTNITNSASWVLITNTAGGCATNLRSQLINFPITNVTVVDITNGTYLVLVGGLNSNLVVTTVGNYARVTYYTSAVYAASAAAFPFTKESDASRAAYMNNVATGLASYATQEIPAAAAPAFRQYVNITTNRQSLTNKAAVNFDMISGRIGSAEVTNLDFYPKWTVGDREDIGGSGGAELTFNSYDGATWLTLKPNAFTGVPMLLSGSGEFYDLIDNATEGLETNSSLINIGTFWRWAPKLSSLGSLPFEYTNEWTTFQYYTNAYGGAAFTTYAVGYDVYHQGRLNSTGGGVITNLTALSATNGNFTTLSANTATIQDATILQANLGAANATNITTRGTILFSSKVRYGVTNFTSLASGNNPAVQFGSNSMVRISGLTNDASITGLAGGVSGDTYLVFNDSAYNVNFVQSTSDPTPANRFANYGGRDEQILPGGWGLVSYVGASSRWTTALTYPAAVAATNAVASLNGGATNLSLFGPITWTNSSGGVKMIYVGTNGVLYLADAPTGGTGSGETNLLGNAGTTNNTTTFGLVSVKNGVTNFLKTIKAGSNVTITDQGGTNLLFDVSTNLDFGQVNAGSFVISNLTANSILFVNSTGLVSSVTNLVGLSLSNGTLTATGGSAAGTNQDNLTVTNYSGLKRHALSYTGGTNVIVNCATGNRFYLWVTNTARIKFSNVLDNADVVVNVRQGSNTLFGVVIDPYSVVTNSSIAITSGTNTASQIRGCPDDTGTNLVLTVLTNLQPQISTFGSTNGGGGGGGGATYLVNQNFEGTGYDNSESWTTSGTVDPDYTATALTGSQSFQTADIFASAYISFSGQTTAYAFTQYRQVYALSSATARSNFSIRDSSGNILCAFKIDSSGAVRLEASGSDSSASATSVAISTTWNTWLTFTSGGTCELAMSTSTTKPTSDGGGNVFLTKTGASGTASRLYLDNWDGSTIWDHVLVDDVAIGNNP